MRMNRCRYIMIAAASAVCSIASVASAQMQAPAQPPPSAPEPPATTSPAPAPPEQASSATAPALEQLAWLRGCWAGKVDRFDFIEQWSAPRAGMMVGVSQTTVQDKQKGARTDDYTYLRLEARADGLYYVAISSGKKESAFKFASATEDKGHTAYTFTAPGEGFPQRIVYVRGAGGWLYAQVAGKVGGQAKEVTYPMRRVDCATGALIEN